MSPAEPIIGIEQLRGLHLPASGAVGAQSEIVLAAAFGFAAALAVGLFRLLRARRLSSVRRSALRELSLTRALAPETRLVAQARLLRRLARTLGGEASAATTGAEWSATLDRLLATDFFSRGAGRALADGLYRRDRPDQPVIDAELGRLIARIRA